MPSASKVEARLRHSRRCRHCRSPLISLAKVAQAIGEASGHYLERARADLGNDPHGHAYARAVGMLDEALPSLSAKVLGFCDLFCERAHERRQAEASA